jgi:hypothetical protein
VADASTTPRIHAALQAREAALRGHRVIRRTDRVPRLDASGRKRNLRLPSLGAGTEKNACVTPGGTVQLSPNGIGERHRAPGRWSWAVAVGVGANSQRLPAGAVNTDRVALMPRKPADGVCGSSPG